MKSEVSIHVEQLSYILPDIVNYLLYNCPRFRFLINILEIIDKFVCILKSKVYFKPELTYVLYYNTVKNCFIKLYINDVHFLDLYIFQ